MKIDIWFDKPIGIKLFNKIGKLYFDENGVFPKTLTELPRYITDLGYPCTPANIKPPLHTHERCGVTLDEEVATALILKYT